VGTLLTIDRSKTLTFFIESEYGVSDTDTILTHTMHVKLIRFLDYYRGRCVYVNVVSSIRVNASYIDGDYHLVISDDMIE
jgi:hypothetical protein